MSEGLGIYKIAYEEHRGPVMQFVMNADSRAYGIFVYADGSLAAISIDDLRRVR